MPNETVRFDPKPRQPVRDQWKVKHSRRAVIRGAGFRFRGSIALKALMELKD